MSPAVENVAGVLDELCANWEVRQIQEVAEVNPRIDKKAIPDDIEVSFVPMPAVKAESGAIDVSQTKLAQEVKKGFTAFLEGDVLFAKITPCMENGKMAIAPSLVNDYGFGSTEFHVLRSKEGLDAKYLYYYVSSRSFRGEAERFMTGAVGQKRVSTTYIKEATIPVAPLEDQRRIVAEIEKQFSRLDEAVASLKRVKANLKRYKAAVLKAAVEGKLTEEWRKQNPDVEPASKLLERILTERRTKWEEAEFAKMKAKGKEPKDDKWKDKYKAPELPDSSERPELPDQWCWSLPDFLAKNESRAICAGPFGTIFKAKDFRESGVPIIFLRHVKPGQYRTHKPGFMDQNKWEELFQEYSVYGGELLITKLGEPPGVCAIYPDGIGPAMVTPDVMKMSVDDQVINKKYLMYYFNSQICRRITAELAFGTTRLRLTLPIFRKLSVPIPPMAEQIEIVDEVEQKLSLVDGLEREIERDLKRVEVTRQSVLAAAFSGASMGGARKCA